jgi:hypothetical protein
LASIFASDENSDGYIDVARSAQAHNKLALEIDTNSDSSKNKSTEFERFSDTTGDENKTTGDRETDNLTYSSPPLLPRTLVDLFQSYQLSGEQIIEGAKSFFHYCYNSVENCFKRLSSCHSSQQLQYRNFSVGRDE